MILRVSTKRMVGNMLLIGLASCLLAVGPAARAGTQKAAKAARSAKAPGLARTARNPYLGAMTLDAASGRVLFEDQADAKGYPASVLKLMDLLLVLERIEQGQLSLQEEVTTSAKASHTGGSRVWLADKESFTVDELLYALMVQSANDAAVALAEKVGGSTEGFVELMNKRAKELGMTNTLFRSVHGLPPGRGQEPDVTTARDLSLLCRAVLKHPDTLRYASTRERAFRTNVPKKKPVIMRTHNHLLGRLEGCDGLKTGWIDAAGYSIALTAARHGQRVIVVVLDSSDRQTRDARAAELVAKGLAALGAAAPAPARQPAGKSARKEAGGPKAERRE
jgi:D-alanyl-D-alanine carboxypeptidase (penicillin-binding protein 5/6)